MVLAELWYSARLVIDSVEVRIYVLLTCSGVGCAVILSKVEAVVE